MAEPKIDVSDEDYAEYLADEDFVTLGWYFWHAFCTLPKEDPKRIKANARFDALTQNQKRACEST